MDYIISGILGYLLGCLNPAYFLGKARHIDIRQAGTGNLGTTNAFLVLGGLGGCFVLFFDIMKAFAAVRLCQWLFPASALAGVLAGCGAVIGHVFPFYLKFHGGKGVAGFVGVILSQDWRLLLILLVIGCAIALMFNYGCSISCSIAALFPICYAVEVHSLTIFFLLAICGGVIIYRHKGNIDKIKLGEEIPVRTFLYRHIYRKRV